MTQTQTTPAGARTQDGSLDIRVGRFVSKYSDGETYREGVKDHRFFRAVHYTDERGQKLSRVCLIETPDDRNCDEHMEAIRKVLTLLDAGERSIRLCTCRYCPTILRTLEKAQDLLTGDQCSEIGIYDAVAALEGRSL